MNLIKNLEIIKIKLEQLVIEKNKLIESKANLKKEIKNLQKEKDVLEEVRDCLLKSQEEIRKHAISFTEEIVNWGLREIFNNPNLEFKIDLTYKWNKPEMNFLVRYDKNVPFIDVVDGEAGGMKDIVGVLLRFSLILLNKIDFPIILDEVGKHISKEYRENFAKFLRIFSEKFQKQIILITHQDEVIREGHKIIRFSLGSNNETKINYN
jgi:DNA repair exonuclease SbcCD ATPase subunit